MYVHGSRMNGIRSKKRCSINVFETGYYKELKMKNVLRVRI